MRFGIPGAPVGFRMELYRCQAKIFVLKPFNRSIVDICIGHAAAFGQGPGIHRKTVILGGDEDATVFEPHRLVCPTVAELEFVGITAKGESGYLVSHTDPKDGEFPEEVLYAAYRIRGLFGIARAVTHKEGIRFAGPT